MVPDDERLESLLDEWERLREQGAKPDLAQLCAACPELLPDLERRIDVLQRFARDFDEETLPRGPADAPSDLQAEFGGRYQVRQVHDAGGQGIVYVAVDRELNRRIVVKTPNRQTGAGVGFRQFEHEAKLTGQLEHPGIVPVYGYGHDGQGRPYYAMRYIDGTTLLAAMEKLHRQRFTWQQCPLEARRLLHAFLVVCRTVAFAHDRKIVHRDIKPSNIMLGKYGEVLLVDWGLAKTLQEAAAIDEPSESAASPAPSADRSVDIDSTRQGTVKGTLRYMSPEQASGDVVNIGSASDIYSLGATLYEMLSGQPLFAGLSSAELLAHVRQGAVPPLRQLDPRIPAPLSAICQRAMATDPAGRYPSAEALADDLERWLADEPVEAFPDPWRAKVARWVRRHRTLATTSAAILLVSVVALTAFAILLGQKNRDLQIARGKTEAALQQAQRESERAQQSLRTGLDAVHSVLVQVGMVDLAYVPEMEQVRVGILQNATRFLEGFRGFENSAQLQREQGLAGLYLADVQRQLSQLAPAEENFQRALAIHTQLANTYPENLQYQHDLAVAWHDYGRASMVYQPQVAREYLPRSVARLEELITKGFPAQEALAIAANTASTEAMQRGDGEEAQRLLRRSAELWEQQIAAQPQRAEQFRVALAQTYHNLGQALLQDLGQALPLLERAREILAKPVDDPVLARRNRSNLVEVLNTLAMLYQSNGRQDEAFQMLQEGLAMREELATLYPHSTHVKDNVARAQHNLGVFFQESHRPQEAADAYAQAIVLRRRLLDLAPDDDYVRVGLAESCLNAALLAASDEKVVLAEAMFQEAQEALELLTQRNPETIRYQISLAANEINFGNFLRDLQRQNAAALARHQAAVARLDQLAGRGVADAFLSAHRINAHGALATTLRSCNRVQEAVPHCDAIVTLAAEADRIHWRLWRLQFYLEADPLAAADEGRQLLATGKLTPTQFLAVSALIAQALVNPGQKP